MRLIFENFSYLSPDTNVNKVYMFNIVRWTEKILADDFGERESGMYVMLSGIIMTKVTQGL